ncbi:MAG: bactofilin family protein [Vicinamibacterales bacterium]
MPLRLVHLSIKGDLTAEEDLTIDSRFEGRIDIRNHRLVVGPDAHVHADDGYVGDLVVYGRLTGRLVVARTADIRDTARVEGRLVASVVGMSDGAHFTGSIDTHHADIAARVADHRIRKAAVQDAAVSAAGTGR